MVTKICPKNLNHLQGRGYYEIENMKYCPSCGEKLIKRKCEKCHADMNIDYIYCIKCGHGDKERVQKKMLKNLNSNNTGTINKSIISNIVNYFYQKMENTKL